MLCIIWLLAVEHNSVCEIYTPSVSLRELQVFCLSNYTSK